MIYCFTGTGNSLQIAEAISSRTGQSVMRITENMFLPDSSEDVWIVSPVYFFNQPPLVRDFVDSLKPARGRKVVFVFNYGSTPGRVCKKSVRELNKRGFTDVSAFGIRMPENYIMLFSVPPEDKCEKMKDSVDSLVDDIVSKVSKTNYVNNKGLGFGSLLTFFGNTTYGMMSKTKKFCVEENCTGCGACAKLCPRHIIEMSEGKPVWTQTKCDHCNACINRCPVEAIQYGKSTKKKKRYVNDRVKL